MNVCDEHEISCWICDKQFFRNAIGTDMLLSHMNKEHATDLHVGCPWCNAQFQCQGDRVKHREDLHDSMCPVRCKDKEKRAATAHVRSSKSCKCVVHDTVFSTKQHLLRHFNDAHGARFSKWSVLVCDRCGNRNISSIPAMQSHVCGKPAKGPKVSEALLFPKEDDAALSTSE
jgi:hypothetical protein